MIEIFEGRLGGGKSYFAVLRMLRYLQQGGTVCTNITLNWQGVLDWCEKRGFRPQESRRCGLGWSVSDWPQYRYLQESEIANFHRRTPTGTTDCPTLVVIDEAHLYWNSRDFAKTDKSQREMLSFLSQSRKAATDIIFISQSLFNMDSQFTRLVQYIWRFRDMDNYKIPGLGVPWLCKWPIVGRLFPQLLNVQCDYDGRTVLNRGWEFKNKEIFRCYQTTELLRSFLRSGNVGRAKLTKIKKRGKRMKFLLLFALIVLGVSLKASGLLGGKDDGPEVVSSTPAPESPSRPPGIAPPSYTPPVAQEVPSDKIAWPDQVITDSGVVILIEGFRSSGRSWDGREFLQTAKRVYRVGMVTRYGRVTELSLKNQTASIRGFDGSPMMVQAVDDRFEQWEAARELWKEQGWRDGSKEAAAE